MVHGVSGFLIQSQEQAYDALMALHDDVDLRYRVGHAARQQAIKVHGPEATQRDLAFYLF